MPSSAPPPPEELGPLPVSPRARWFEALARELSGEGHLPIALLRNLSSECLKKGLSLPRVLAERRLLTEEVAYRAWAKILGVAYIDLDPSTLDPATVRLLPSKLCEKLDVIPVRNDDGEITVAMVDPNDVSVVDEIRRHLAAPLLVVMASPGRVREALTLRSFEDPGPRQTLDLDRLDLSQLSNADDLEKVAGDDALIEMVNQVVTQAVRSRASDIHIEPREDKLRIRYRIDGVLEEIHALPPALHGPLVSRVKILANLDIAEKRKPLDGAIDWEISSMRSVELRVSTLPTVHGEKVVMRILDRAGFHHGLDSIELFPEQLQGIRNLISRSHGILFSTGPTGSGKTTTLYAILQALNGAQLNITTIEDPVEYRLPYLNQVQVDEKANRTFASVLRSILRQDPDVILVGEIRDKETATIAVQAALTGHLVLSTLHANSATQAVPRLLNIGVEAHLLAPSLLGVHAQRLVRRVCPACREPYEPDPMAVEIVLGKRARTPLRLVRGAGCDDCRGTGYAGRLPLHELLVVGEEVRELIYRGGSARDVEKAALRKGFRTLIEDGIRKSLAGLTTLEEVARVASGG